MKGDRGEGVSGGMEESDRGEGGKYNTTGEQLHMLDKYTTSKRIIENS